MLKVIILTVVLASYVAPAFAGDGHNHENALENAPHGGTLRDAENLKAEAVLAGDQVKIFIYDKKLKPLKPEQETFTGTVEFPKQKKVPVTFKRNGDYYESTIKGLSKTHRYDLMVKLQHGGKDVEVDFGIDNI